MVMKKFHLKYRFIIPVICSIVFFYCDHTSIVDTEKPIPGDSIINTGLPVISITTDWPFSSLNKAGWQVAQIKLFNNPSVQTDVNPISVQIKGRGNSSWDLYPKKPFNLKFEEKVSMPGLPKDKKWKFLANYRDKTLLRNELAFEISRRTDLRWTPKTAFSEVLTNGTHVGNYQICEDIEISNDKIDIGKNGILFEMDVNYDETWKFKTELCSLPVMIKEPDIDDLKLTELQDYFNALEKVLYSDSFNDAAKGYRKYLNVNSFIDYYLVYELMFCQEPLHPKSVYLVRNDNLKLEMGPVWDFDWFTCAKADGFAIDSSLWYKRLLQDPFFRSTLYQRWEVLMFKLLDINDFIDKKGSSLKVSQKINCDIWGLNDTDYIAINYGSYDDYLSALKDYFNARISWLDNAFKELAK